VSIRLRLTLWFVLALAVLLAAGSAATYLIERAQLRGQVHDAARRLAHTAAATEEPDEAELDRLAGAGDRIWLLDSRGRVVAATFGAPGRTRAAVTAYIDRQRAREPGELVTARALRRAGGEAIVLRPADQLDGALSDLRWALVAVGLVGVVLAAGTGALLARRALRPVDRMIREVDRIPGEALDRRLPEERSDELGRLARAFNRLLGRAERASREQERFVADASHELKTPVTALEGHARVVARALERGDLQRARDSAAVVQREARRLALVLRELLLLAETGETAGPASPVRLDEAVADACEEIRALDPARPLDVELSPTTVAGDRGRLRELALILLDNAVKYSATMSPVSVRVEDGDRPRLSVRDRGPGLSAEERERAFERFYRGPAARGVPGSGLGLAIARAICERHGAELELAPDPEGGTRAVVEFEPTSRSPTPP
jgi:two-component system sensor histidine kinase MprB